MVWGQVCINHMSEMLVTAFKYGLWLWELIQPRKWWGQYFSIFLSRGPLPAQSSPHVNVPMSILMVAHTIRRPESLPSLFRGIFEVSGAVATPGILEHRMEHW